MAVVVIGFFFKVVVAFDKVLDVAFVVVGAGCLDARWLRVPRSLDCL